VAWRDAVEVYSMDGCTEFKTTAEDFPGAVAVMDSFNVARVAGKASNKLPRQNQ
jgi:transposase